MTYEEMARDRVETRRINDDNYRAWKKRIRDINAVENHGDFLDRIDPERKKDAETLRRLWEKRVREIYRGLCASE